MAQPAFQIGADGWCDGAQKLPSQNFDIRCGPHPIDLLVIHTMEAPEKPDTAENVAKWFAGSTAPQASAHYCIDADSIVQCVQDRDVAWHAPGANHNGLGFEHAGTAGRKTVMDRDF